MARCIACCLSPVVNTIQINMYNQRSEIFLNTLTCYAMWSRYRHKLRFLKSDMTSNFRFIIKLQKTTSHYILYLSERCKNSYLYRIKGNCRGHWLKIEIYPPIYTVARVAVVHARVAESGHISRYSINHLFIT